MTPVTTGIDCGMNPIFLAAGGPWCNDPLPPRVRSLHTSIHGRTGPDRDPAAKAAGAVVPKSPGETPKRQGSGERPSTPGGTTTAQRRMADRPHLSRFEVSPSWSNARANQFPRPVNRAEPSRCFVVNVNIPSRARFAIVTPDSGLPRNGPCQAPAFL